MTPDRFVLAHARIHTVNAAQPVAEALAVEAGRIVAVGTGLDIAVRFGGWPRVSAGGRTVVPGFIDAHAHLLGLGQARMQADLTGTRSVAEVVERLAAFAATAGPGRWLTGLGWDQNAWGIGAAGGMAGAFPTRHDLDAAFPDRPVWLTRIDIHAGWANTAALRAAGLDPDGPAPPDAPGGYTLRDAAGRPTGVFVDAAMDLVRRALPPATDRAEALRRATAETAAAGLTGVHDAGVPLATVDFYAAEAEAGRLPIRVYAMIEPGELDAFCARGPLVHPSGRLVVRALKLFADGALGSRGAALLADYVDAAGTRGLMQMPPERLRDLAERAMRGGLQVVTHAIGDAANRAVLDAYEAAIAATGGGPGRHRIEHVQVLDAADVGRFAALGVVASVQPTHATSDMGWAETRLGPDRIASAYPMRRLLDAGTRLALGSDFPIERVPPLLGFHAAVTRTDAAGNPPGGWHAAEALTRAEALRGFTRDAAHAAFMEDEVGSLETGKRADFVVLSQDLMAVPDDRILATRVLATYLDGEPIYEEAP